MTVRIDNNVIRQPGEAILHFVCEGENLRAEFDRTIRVVDYSEYPAFTAVQEKAEYTFYPGDKLEPAKVAGMALTENIHSIAGTLPQNDCDYYPFYSLGYWDFNPSLSYDDQAFSGMFDVKYEQSEYNYKEWYEAARSGSCTVSAIGTFNNVMVAVPVTLNVLGYSLNGPEMIKPGETAEYTINQADNTARTFTYTVEGEGATFADGKLTAGGDIRAEADAKVEAKTLASKGDKDEGKSDAYVAGFSTSMWLFLGMAVCGEILALLMFRYSVRRAMPEEA